MKKSNTLDVVPLRNTPFLQDILVYVTSWGRWAVVRRENQDADGNWYSYYRRGTEDLLHQSDISCMARLNTIDNPGDIV
jgi:hypothetical protein